MFFNINPDGHFVDKFYDYITAPEGSNEVWRAKYGELGIYKKARFNGETRALVEKVCQKTLPIAGNCLVYNQTPVSESEWKLLKRQKPFLTVGFKRYNLKNSYASYHFTNTNLKNTKCYLDKVVSNNIIYSVVGISCTIDMPTSGDWSLMADEIKTSFVSFLQQFASYYPVYTKFMYCLRLSEYHHLYKDVFQRWAVSSDKRIENTVDKLLGEETSDKAYIWEVSHVHEMFESGLIEGLSVEESIALVNEQREELLNDDSIHFGHSHFDD